MLSRIKNTPILMILINILINITYLNASSLSRYGFEDKNFIISYSDNQLTISAVFIDKNTNEEIKVNLNLIKLINVNNNNLNENSYSYNIAKMQVIDFWNINTSYFSVNLPKNDMFETGILNIYIYNKNGEIGNYEKFKVNRGDMNIRIYIENIHKCICQSQAKNDDSIDGNIKVIETNDTCCNEGEKNRKINLDFNLSILKNLIEENNNQTIEKYLLFPEYYRNSTNFNKVEQTYDITSRNLSFNFREENDFIIYDFIIKSKSSFNSFSLLNFILILWMII